MSDNTAPNIEKLEVGEVRNFAVDFAGMLDAGELLTGTPTVTEMTTSDLTISNKVVSTDALTIEGRTAAAGEAVQFSVSGQQASTKYRIKISVETDATPAQTLIGYVRFNA